MKRLLTLVKGIDMTDLALVAGAGLLWVGLDKITDWAPYIGVASLLLLYGAAPMIVALTRRSK